MIEYAIILVMTLSGTPLQFLLGNTYTSPRECDLLAEELTQVLQPAASPAFTVAAHCISLTK